MLPQKTLLVSHTSIGTLVKLYYYFSIIISSVFSDVVYLPTQDSYDFIIAGGGSAGCVLANRLSASGDYSVLLVEAGVDDRANFFSSTPGLAFFLWNDPTSWRYKYEPIPNAIALNNNQTLSTGGKILGGSGSTNGMIFVRGSRHDYNRWAEHAGDESWDYRHVLPYFQKMESFGDARVHADPSSVRGQDGPLSINYAHRPTLVSTDIIEAFVALGIPYNEDYNGHDMLGVNRVQATVDETAHRSSTSRTYLHPVLSRPNLEVVVNAFVNRVIIDGSAATGIEFIKRQQSYSVHANREVIVSGGGIGSPRILMLSGIGPRAHLEEFNIPVVRDLPVGYNLQDHRTFLFPVAIDDPSSFPLLDDVVNGPLPFLISEVEYFNSHTGDLSSSPVESQLFTKVLDNEDPEDWPDLQILFHAVPQGPSVLAALNYDMSVLEEIAPIRYSQYGFTALITNSRPVDRGQVRLRSLDIQDLPVMDGGNTFNEPEDLSIMLHGVRICREALETEAMQRIGARFSDFGPVSYCSQHEFLSEEYWTCLIKSAPTTVQHPVGTCKMGRPDDPTTVVDSQLRVLGIDNLRVVDGSIMPYITSGNTYGPIIMIAEKMADVILGNQPLPPIDAVISRPL